MSDADSSEVSLTWSSERTMRIGLGDAATDAARRRVRRVFEQIGRARVAGVVDITPAYATVQVEFDPLVVEAERVERAVRAVVADALRAADAGSRADGDGAAARKIVVPVCHEGEYAPDLADLAALRGLSESDVVAMHTAPEYHVCFLGFSPGFGYLSGLPEGLWTERLASPRRRVEAGSVGIAGSQTGIYPQATPGGWRLIGRTPLRMFDAARAAPALLSVGDVVRFRPISRAEFDAIAASEE